MLVFVVPVKSKSISRSWSLLSILFERCIRSICSQTDDSFKVIIVCNDRPNTNFLHPNLHYVEVDFLPPTSDGYEQDILGGYDYGYSQDIARKNADKARKILRGIEYSQRFNPNHIMVVDADDCVSQNLAKFVNQDPNCDGWVMKKGYIYREGSRWLIKNIKNFNQISGTSVIFKNEIYSVLFENPDFYFHSFDSILEADIKPLPFIGSLYSMGNGENIYMTSETISKIGAENIFSGAFKLLQKVMKYRVMIMSDSVRREFGAYEIKAVKTSLN